MTKTSTAATTFFMGLLFYSSAFAEDAAQSAQWLFVNTAQTAEVTSATTVVMPVTREIFAFTDRPNRAHAYMNAHEFVALWDEGDSDSFYADPPNAVLTWVDGNVVQEAELVISNAEAIDFGKSISFEVQFEVGESPDGVLDNVSIFVDSWNGWPFCNRTFGCDPT